MNEVIETEKWKIYFKKPANQDIDESYIELIFRLRSDQRSVGPLNKEDLEQLQNDIKDLGKWRRFKELKEDLETHK